MRGLVVGNNLNATAAVGQDLGADGFHITLHHSLTTYETLEHLRHTDCDAVMFDCSMVSCNGDCLIRRLRAQGNCVPILVIGAHGPNWTGCLDAGADDYISVPYEPKVLQARFRALVRRARYSGLGSVLQVDDLYLNPKTRAVHRAGKPIELTQREFSLLECLMRHEGEICKRTVLLEKVWGLPANSDTKVVDMTVARLRPKIDAPGFETKLIHNVRAVGYRLSAVG